jgi:hypothetical protein
MPSKSKERKPAEETPVTTEPLTVNYESCTTLSFHVETRLDPKISAPLQIDITPLIALSYDDAKITIDLSIEGYTEAPKADNQIYSLTTRHAFDVHGMENYTIDNGQRIQLPEGFMSMLVSVALGTTRGMLVEKLAATALKAQPLPIVIVQELFPGMNTVEFLQQPTT